MRITEAAQRLGTSPRMLRYREALGLLPPVGHGPGHRQFRDQDVAAVALGLELERRLDISPAALAFGLRVLAEPGVRAQVAELGRRIGRVPPPGSALDFEKERALRLLSMGHRTDRTAPPSVLPAPAHPPGHRPPARPRPSLRP
ncbi:MAG: MerR family transcriptional regulator [Streptosporangiaceae bacterium]|jgi:hypothetical protein